MNHAFLIAGQVMHERLRPVRNRFVYPVFCLRCNVDELDRLDCWWFGVDRPHLVGIRRRDYGDGSRVPGEWIRKLLADAGLRTDGEIWLQTFPRLLGFVFNPVSFWYCHDETGSLVALLADVRNTFGERHRYLLTGSNGGSIQPGEVLRCRKVFHVSPFCEVEGHYAFRLRETDGATFVGIDYMDRDGLLLKTAVGGRRYPLTAKTLWSAILRQPLLTFGVVVRIHIQALRLWCAGVTFFKKPAPPQQALSRSNPEGNQA